jgi:hypothetical protein
LCDMSTGAGEMVNPSEAGVSAPLEEELVENQADNAEVASGPPGEVPREVVAAPDAV